MVGRMSGAIQAEVTVLLKPASRGDGPAAEKLLPLVYGQLRELAAKKLSREAAGHTLQATALVHEAYLRLVDQTQVDWQGKTHFFSVAATMIRRVLVDHARKKLADKRGGGARTVILDETAIIAPGLNVDLIALDEALDELARLDERASQVVELRFFGGLTENEIAEKLGVSERTVRDNWKTARAWLRCKLDPGG